MDMSQLSHAICFYLGYRHGDPFRGQLLGQSLLRVYAELKQVNRDLG